MPENKEKIVLHNTGYRTTKETMRRLARIGVEKGLRSNQELVEMTVQFFLAAHGASPVGLPREQLLSDNQTVPVNGEHVISDLREALHQMGLAVELAENAIRAGSTQGNGEVDGGETQRTKVADRRPAKGGKTRPIRSAV